MRAHITEAEALKPCLIHVAALRLNAVSNDFGIIRRDFDAKGAPYVFTEVQDKLLLSYFKEGMSRRAIAIKIGTDENIVKRKRDKFRDEGRL